jgi:Zn-dependent protease with chaperone function
MLAISLVWPHSSPLWVWAGMVSLLGAVVGTLPLDHEMFPRIERRDLWRQAAISTLQRFLLLFVFLGGIALMPDEFGEASWIIAGVVIGIGIVWLHGGSLWLGQRLGLIVPAPDRLRRIVDETSVKMNIPYRNLWVMRVSLAQAAAVLETRSLVFTERLLELSPNDELAAICAHELAHLTESMAARYARHVQMMTFLPWLFFAPLIHSLGMFGLLALCGCSVSVPKLYRMISRKLELRADSMGLGSEGDAGTYARALTRLYEDNLLPAVIAKKTTHPDLYDRILAAGMTPEFDKPKPAGGMAWNGVVFALLLGVMIALFTISSLSGRNGGF